MALPSNDKRIRELMNPRHLQRHTDLNVLKAQKSHAHNGSIYTRMRRMCKRIQYMHACRGAARVERERKASTTRLTWAGQTNRCLKRREWWGASNWPNHPVVPLAACAGVKDDLHTHAMHQKKHYARRLYSYRVSLCRIEYAWIKYTSMQEAVRIAPRNYILIQLVLSEGSHLIAFDIQDCKTWAQWKTVGADCVYLVVGQNQRVQRITPWECSNRVQGVLCSADTG
jgi:hypothetical protein